MCTWGIKAKECSHLAVNHVKKKPYCLIRSAICKELQIFAKVTLPERSLHNSYFFWKCLDNIFKNKHSLLFLSKTLPYLGSRAINIMGYRWKLLYNHQSELHNRIVLYLWSSWSLKITGGPRQMIKH